MAGEAARLMVVVGADVSQATTALKTVDQQVENTAKNVNSKTQEAEGAFQRMNSAASILSGGIGGVMAVAGGVGIGALALNAGKAAIELGTMGQQVEKQKAYFEAYSGGAEAAAANMAAMNEAVGDTMTSSEKMQAATQLLSMGLAKGPEDLKKMAEMAVMLGGSTRTAGEAINEFALTLANQSVERLDTFGISSGLARDRVTELMSATEGLSREQAFMSVVVEIGSQKVDMLRDAGIKATTSAEDLKTAWGNFREELAVRLAPAVGQAQGDTATLLGQATAAMKIASDDQGKQLEGLRSRYADLENQMASAQEKAKLNPVAAVVQGVNIKEIQGQLKETADAIAYLENAMATSSDVGVSASAEQAQSYADTAKAAQDAATATTTAAKEQTDAAKEAADKLAEAEKTYAESRKKMGLSETVKPAVSAEALKPDEAAIDEVSGRVYSAFVKALASKSVQGATVKALIGQPTTKDLDPLATSIAQTLRNSMDAQRSQFEATGKSLIDSVAEGAKSAEDNAVLTVDGIAKAMLEAMQKALEMGSPSRAFMRIGYTAIDSLGIGAAAAASGVVSRVHGIGQDLLGGGYYPGRQAGGYGVTGSGRVAYFGGDSYIISAGSDSAAAMTASMIGDKKRDRMREFMGG